MLLVQGRQYQIFLVASVIVILGTLLLGIAAVAVGPLVLTHSSYALFL